MDKWNLPGELSHEDGAAPLIMDVNASRIIQRGRRRKKRFSNVNKDLGKWSFVPGRNFANVRKIWLVCLALKMCIGLYKNDMRWFAINPSPSANAPLRRNVISSSSPIWSSTRRKGRPRKRLSDFGQMDVRFLLCVLVCCDLVRKGDLAHFHCGSSEGMSLDDMRGLAKSDFFVLVPHGKSKEPSRVIVQSFCGKQRRIPGLVCANLFDVSELTLITAQSNMLTQNH